MDNDANMARGVADRPAVSEMTVASCDDLVHDSLYTIPTRVAYVVSNELVKVSYGPRD